LQTALLEVDAQILSAVRGLVTGWRAGDQGLVCPGDVVFALADIFLSLRQPVVRNEASCMLLSPGSAVYCSANTRMSEMIEMLWVILEYRLWFIVFLLF
jgi:hypothetical protein